MLGSSALVAAAFLISSGVPSPASACGGLFCSNNPVDQNAERILFEVNADGSVSATVEIAFTGDPENFSWIVPVNEVPTEMAVAPLSSLRLLDMATAPSFIPPPTKCSGFAPPSDPSADFAGEGEGEGEGGVVVVDLPTVGPFDPEVVSSADPDELVLWLEENGYVITEAMKPFIREYSEQGFKFLAVKLTPDAGVSDIAPLKFTCPNGAPMVPIKLTAIASEPEMGVLVFVAGAGRFQSTNFPMIEVDTDLVQVDPRRSGTNYYPLTSWLIDQAGGKAFITELAESSTGVAARVDSTNLSTPDIDEARDFVGNVLGSHAYVTRMYSRMSGWEMDDDPQFAGISAGDVSNVHDLSDRPAVEVCGDVGNLPPVPCGRTYCGVNQACATTTSGASACICGEGFSARAITAPVGRGIPTQQSVHCQKTDFDVLQSLEDLDPCAGSSCGDNGECLPVNGFATCRCDDGFAARVSFNGGAAGLECETVTEIYAPDQLLWPVAPYASEELCACAGVPRHTPATALAFVGVLLGLGLTSRRRRR